MEVIGAIAYKDIRQIVTYNVVITVGFILVGLAVSTEIAMQGSIYYLVHDMIIKALLFLVAGTMIYLTGTSRIEKMSGLIQNYPVLGWLFLSIDFITCGHSAVKWVYREIICRTRRGRSGSFSAASDCFSIEYVCPLFAATNFHEYVLGRNDY